MWLTRLSITRPVTILMLVMALIIMGLQSRSRLPVDLYPDVQFPMLFISTVYPGTGPEEIETLLSKPIEDAVSTVSDLNKITSTSSEGVSTVMMEFELGTDLNEVSSDVRSKLDALRNMLPEDAKSPVVIKADIGSMPVIALSISSDRRSSIDIRRLADDVMKDQLSQVTGVASVAVSGGDVREIRVEIDKARLEAYGVNITQVIGALQAENLNLPSGSVEETRRNYAVRVLGEFDAPGQIGNVRIPNSTGNPNLTIGDVATVTDSIAEANSYTRVNKNSSVALVVQKQSDANTVKVVEEVKKELTKLTGRNFDDKKDAPLVSLLKTLHLRGAAEKMQAAFDAKEQARELAERQKDKRMYQVPEDIQLTVTMNQATFIEEALEDVYRSLGEGALLAILIVFLFLHSVRGTFIVALAIPTSMIASFLVMDLCGLTINMMSMLGLSLSVGILVDDSIVVIENIHRHLAAGLSPKEAAIKGRTEIGQAAMTITMVDVVVFVPIAFMGGIVGQFFRDFGITVATATLFSLFVSFTLTPMLSSRWLKSHAEEEAEEKKQQEHPGLFRRFVTAWEGIYGRVDYFYRSVLLWALEHHALVICLGVMTMVASFAAAMPKPHVVPMLKGLPLLLGGLAILFGLWLLVRLTRGVLRYVLTFIGLPVSFFLAVAVAKGAKIGTPMIMMLMIILVMGIVGFALTWKAKDGKGHGVRAVATPLAVWAAVLLAICLLVPTQFGVAFAPQVDRGEFSVSVEQEVGTPLDVTDATTRRIERALLNPKEFPEVETVFTTVGSTRSSLMGAGGAGSDTAEMSIKLRDEEEGDRSSEEIISAINARFAKVPGATVTAKVSESGPGGDPINIELSGNDMATIQRAADQVAEAVKRAKGTYAVQLSWREGRPEVQAHVDRDRAAQYGLNVSQVAAALHTALEGDTSSKYREGGKEYDIRVVLPETQRDVISQLPMMVVGTSSTGRPIYLYEVMRLERASGPTKIERTNRQRSVSVTAQLMKGVDLGTAQAAINEQVKNISVPGVTVNWSGQAEQMKESFGHMGSAMLLAIVLVFMLMAALFESLLSPAIILLAVPQAMAGAIFAISFTHNTLNIISMIGIIMLVGLVTKNAILLVDYTNTLRKEDGLDRRSALLKAGPTRLRPILMTTLAMIFGMMPTAMALNNGAEMRQPMAIAVIGGLMLSMFLTLVMVPVFYEILDGVSERINNAKNRLLHVKNTAPEPAPAKHEVVMLEE